MSELYLTDEQVKELPDMGPLGEEAEYELGLWRKTVDGVWVHKDKMLYSVVKSNGHEHVRLIADVFSDRSSLGRKPIETLDAVVYARNTAEFRAALVYWTLFHGTERGFMAERYAQPGDQYEISPTDKIAAIVQALKEMRQ